MLVNGMNQPYLAYNHKIQGGTSIQFVRLDDSIRNKVFNVTLEEMNEFS